MHPLKLGGLGFGLAMALAASVPVAVAYEEGPAEPLPDLEQVARPAPQRAAYAPPPPAALVAHGTSKSRRLRGWGARRG